MIIEKMTKDILMKFLPGEQKVFTLPSFEKAQSAATQAYRAKNFAGSPRVERMTVDNTGILFVFRGSEGFCGKICFSGFCRISPDFTLKCFTIVLPEG